MALQELSDMTGVFKINTSTAPAPPTLLSGPGKENATPPEPEFLSDRIKIKREKLKSEEIEKGGGTFSDLPPSPKLLGTYSFLNK